MRRRVAALGAAGRAAASAAGGALLACLALLAGCGGSTQAPAPAPASPLEPADGRAYAGLSPGAGPEAAGQQEAFLAAGGLARAAIVNQYSSHELSSLGWVLEDLAGRPGIGMISWWLATPAHQPGVPGGTSASIAAGELDAFILARAAEIRAAGRPLFLRLNWEMNAHFFPWGAYDQAGSPRPGNSHADYRNMWRRTVILFGGGSRARIDARLGALGLPGLTSPHARVPATANVAWVWNANYADNPARDDAFGYWPGPGYVDWVGVDWYPDGAQPHAAQAALPAAIYARLSGPGGPGLPFMVGEWGVGPADRPAWAQAMFDWTAARPQVKAQLYFNLTAGPGWLPLEDTPATAAVYRARVADGAIATK